MSMSAIMQSRSAVTRPAPGYVDRRSCPGHGPRRCRNHRVAVASPVRPVQRRYLTSALRLTEVPPIYSGRHGGHSGAGPPSSGGQVPPPPGGPRPTNIWGTLGRLPWWVKVGAPVLVVLLLVAAFAGGSALGRSEETASVEATASPEPAIDSPSPSATEETTETPTPITPAPRRPLRHLRPRRSRRRLPHRRPRPPRRRRPHRRRRRRRHRPRLRLRLSNRPRHRRPNRRSSPPDPKPPSGTARISSTSTSRPGPTSPLAGRTASGSARASRRMRRTT